MDQFAETTTGLIFAANGFNPMMKWDGLAAQMDTVGVVAPTVAVTVAGTGTGSIVGTYTAYLRFVDKDGNYSNLSPVSTEYDTVGTTGTISNITNTTPMVVTSSAHSLTTGNLVKIEGVGGLISANAVWTITAIDSTSFSLDDSSSGDVDYTGGGTWKSGIGTLTYTAVQTPSEPKVTRRQILRNTDGQATTYYVDVDTTNLAATTFSSTRSDVDLAVQEAQAILDSKGNILANRRGLPPSHKQALANHLDRMFAAVQEDYARGSVQVAFGSPTVTGIGTDWTAQMAGRFIYVVGAADAYEILSVSTSAQTLTLTTNYQGATDLFAVYAIRPAPAEEDTVYYSGAGEPEAWLPTDGISLPADNDKQTGIMQNNSYIYFLKKRHIYKLTFQEGPAVDGAVFQSASRGCVNNRCWITVDDIAYALDELGVYKFTGNSDTESISGQIQDIFRPKSASDTRINWNASKWFHACLYRTHETIRWFVALGGCARPKHALCYNYRLDRWWTERYPIPIGGSDAGVINNIPYVFVGGPYRKVYTLWNETTDMAKRADGTIRGFVTGATQWSLTDSLASFASGVVNAPVAIAEGRGRGQQRRIVSATSTSLTLQNPWLVLPDSTSVYQIGGVQWIWRGAWMRFADNETTVDRRLEFVFSQTEEDAKFHVRTRHDFAAAATNLGVTRDSASGNKVASTSGQTDLVVDMANSNQPGYAKQNIPGHRLWDMGGKRYMQLELDGVSNEDLQSLYEVNVEGVGK